MTAIEFAARSGASLLAGAHGHRGSPHGGCTCVRSSWWRVACEQCSRALGRTGRRQRGLAARQLRPSAKRVMARCLVRRSRKRGHGAPQRSLGSELNAIAFEARDGASLWGDTHACVVDTRPGVHRGPP